MRERRRNIAVLAILSAVVSLSASGATAETPVVSAERARELEHLVRQDCGSCHGMTLKGGLGPDLTARRLDGTDRASLASIILDGVPDTPMPPWRPLISESDAMWIAEYLLTERTP